MSKKSHQKELERARAKRAAAAVDSRSKRTRAIAIVLIAAMALTVVAVALASGNEATDVAVDDPAAFSTEGDTDATDTGEQDPIVDPAAAEPCPTDVEAPDVTAEPYEAAPDVTIDTAKVYVATIETTCGSVTLELNPEWAPSAVNNFVTLARDGYYTGVPFHRVIDGFMIQGGDPTGTGHGDGGTFPGYTFEDELGRAEALVADGGVYPRGTVAMANAGPDTNGSQFFIVQVDGWPPNPGPTYTVFGTVLEGLDIVDRIAAGPANGGIAIDPVRMIDVSIEERDA